MMQGHSQIGDDTTIVFRNNQNQSTRTAAFSNYQTLFLTRELNHCSLIREINSLEQNYFELKKYLKTPAVIRYTDLAQLRRQASSPAISRQWQTQLRLAVELLRLGRREEVCWLLNAIERRLTYSSEQVMIFRLWLAVIKVAAGDTAGALTTAQQIIATVDDLHGQQVMCFFRNAARTSSNLMGRDSIVQQISDEVTL